MVWQLLDAGLLDELHLFVHPATAGSGLRLVRRTVGPSAAGAAEVHVVAQGPEVTAPRPPDGGEGPHDRVAATIMPARTSLRST